MASKTHISYLFFTIPLLLQLLHRSAGETNVVKAVYWYNGTSFPVSNIDSTLYTHIFCAFADLDPETNHVTIYPSNVATYSAFTQTVQLKNPSVKTLLSVGTGEKTAYASMASDPVSRKAFIDSSIAIAMSYNFRGLDLDWEFPSSTTDTANLGHLFTEWRAAIVEESQSSGKTPLLLTSAVYYSSTYRSFSYPISSISNSLDWINVMA